MQFELTALNPASEIMTLSRATFGVVLLLLVVIPTIRVMWSSLRTRIEPDNAVDLEELWVHYRHGEISWDEYLRGKVEGVRGLSGEGGTIELLHSNGITS